MIALFAPLILAASQPAPEPEPLVIGETYGFEILGEKHEVHVILPQDYAEQPDKSWPIIVQLDGGKGQDLFLANGIEKWNRLWGRSEPAIVVGIETVDRQRELLPPTTVDSEKAEYPTAGESETFRDWLADEVVPLITTRYRHDGNTILLGESAAGHFVVETWLQRPDLFTGFGAISPSLQWNTKALALNAPGRIDGRPPLYLSLADEGGATEQGMFALLSKMDDAQPYCFSDRRADLHHANSLHGLMPEALQYLLPTDADWLAEYGLVLRCEGRESGIPEL